MVAPETDGDLVARLVPMVEEPGVHLVTFNGTCFDLPVVRALALFYGIPLDERTWASRLLRWGNSPSHTDVLQELAAWVPEHRRSLDHYARFFAIPLPECPVTGATVYDAAQRGDWAGIAEHNRNDVATLARIHHILTAAQEQIDV